MSEDCDICGGSQFINLPRRPKFSCSSYTPDLNVPEPETMSRRFACPACQMATKDHVNVLAAAQIIGRHYPPEASEHAIKTMARAIGDEIVRKGYARIDKRATEFGTEVRLQVAIASPVIIESYAVVINAQAKSFAYRVIDAAKARIANWGAHYDRNTLEKRMAYIFLDESLTSELEDPRHDAR